MNHQELLDEMSRALHEERVIYTFGDTMWKATRAHELGSSEEYWASEKPISGASTCRELTESDTARARFKSESHEVIPATSHAPINVFIGKMKFGCYRVGRDIVKGIVPESIGFGEIDAMLVAQEGSVAFFIVPDLMHRPAKPAQATAETEQGD